MPAPIGGPRFWRRLVSPWLNPVRRMARDWDERARTNAYGYTGGGYGESESGYWASGEPDMQGLILDGLRLEPTAAALEIGCGVGRLLRPLAPRVRRAIGVDISAGMVEQGRRRLADLPNVEFHVTTGRFDAVEEATLDLVYSFAVFQHVPAKRTVATYIAEAARTLRGGGVLRIQVDGRRRPFWRGADTWLGVWYTPEQIRRVLEDRGFTVCDTWGEGTQYYWLTALRNPEPGRPETAAIRADRPEWNRPALGALLARLGHPAAEAADAVVAGRRPLRDFARGFPAAQRAAKPEEFVHSAFATILNRPPDPQGREFFLAELARGASPDYLVDCLIASAELRTLLRLAPASGAGSP